MSLMEMELEKDIELISGEKGKYNIVKNILNKSKDDILKKLLNAEIKEGINNGHKIFEKWKNISDCREKDKIFICNAYDRSSKLDLSNSLFKKNMIEILSSIIIGSYIIEAKDAYIYICEENKSIINQLEEALTLLREDGALGKNILGTKYSLDIKIIEVARETIYGDEISNINILEDKLNYKSINSITNRGEFNNNAVMISKVESLLKLYKVFSEENNTEEYNFVNIKYKNNNSEIIIVPVDTTIKEVIFNKSNIKIDEDNLKGVLVGGNTGVILPKDLIEIKFNNEKIKVAEAGKTINLELIDNKVCIVDFLKTIIEESKEQSCNKCVFCREGSIQIAIILKDITEGKAKNEDINLLKQLSKGISVGAGCSFGKSIPNPVSTALEYFEDEFEDHIKKKKCSTLVCKKYISYHILGNKCIGCEECVDECPTEAILGKRKFIHVIDQDECTKCGKCQEICEADAVVKAGFIKPKTPNRPVPIGSWKRK